MDQYMSSANSQLCVEHCDGEYISVDTQSCIPGCPPGQYMFTDSVSNSCVENCPVGQYISSDNGLCVESCLENEALSSDNLSCSAECPSGELISNGHGLKCPRYQFSTSNPSCQKTFFCRRIYRNEKWINSCETTCKFTMKLK